MKHFTSILVGTIFLSCAAEPDSDPNPLIEITSKSNIAGFEPQAGGGYLVAFGVDGGLTGLRGNAVVRIGVMGDATSAATKVLQIPADPGGQFSAPVSLTVSKPGRHEVFAEFGKAIAHWSVIVPQGKLAFGYLETEGGATEGCVNLVGEAEPLVVETSAGAATNLFFTEGTCDAPGPGKFARFPVTSESFTVGDVDGGVQGVPSVARLEITESAKAGREVEMATSSILPAAGLPFLVRFQVLRGGDPLPYVGYSLSVAPSNLTVATTQVGTTDANGEVSLLITSPVAASAQVLFRTGRFEAVFPLAR